MSKNDPSFENTLIAFGAGFVVAPLAVEVAGVVAFNKETCAVILKT